MAPPNDPRSHDEVHEAVRRHHAKAGVTDSVGNTTLSQGFDTPSAIGSLDRALTPAFAHATRSAA